ncbi:ATP-dependent Clp protease proteolytic subunit [Paraburkholderia nodosa]|uniref:ATP-dependent Clp protease proteolytic subunit n=1 Tax=Paraburkholderia nodosa TaxID=392320 RepID=UPI000550B512|nr:ATP-dependent Clp protease proteolytic subunit [Paraburkholderia nodosa]
MRVFCEILIRGTLLLSFLYGVPAHAYLSKIIPDADRRYDVLNSKIFYTGPVTILKANDLIAALDELNAKYPKLNSIYLYIDSDGGDMDAAYITYRAIHSSRVPVITVNLASVMSAATMMFCGAQDRLSFPGGIFILHPPSIDLSNRFQPDQLNVATENLDTATKMLSDIYSKCTKLNDKEINSIIHSENNRKVLSPDEASANGMVTGIAHDIIDAPVSYYVKDRAQ